VHSSGKTNREHAPTGRREGARKGGEETKSGRKKFRGDRGREGALWTAANKKLSFRKKKKKKKKVRRTWTEFKEGSLEKVSPTGPQHGGKLKIFYLPWKKRGLEASREKKN